MYLSRQVYRILTITKPSQHYFRINGSSARCIAHHTIKFQDDKQDIWREADEVPKNYNLIYRAPLDTALKYFSTYLTVTTGTIGVGAIYYAAFLCNPEDAIQPIVIKDTNFVIAASSLELFTYVGSFIALHIILRNIISKYVLRLYQDGDNYLAVYRGHLWNTIKKHEFHLRELVKIKPRTNLIGWGESKFSLGGKQGILLEKYFKTPHHYNYLLTKKKLDVDLDD